MNDPARRLAEIDDYVTGEMADADAERFEEALFDAAADDTLHFLDRVARLGARSAALGTFDTGVTRAELDAMIAAGRRVALLDIDLSGPHRRPPVGDVDIVVSRFDLGLFDVATVDCELELEGIGQVKTLRDVKVDPIEGAVYACCDVHLFRIVASVPQKTIGRVYAERDGKRELVAVIESLPTER